MDKGKVDHVRMIVFKNQFVRPVCVWTCAKIYKHLGKLYKVSSTSKQQYIFVVVIVPDYTDSYLLYTHSLENDAIIHKSEI